MGENRSYMPRRFFQVAGAADEYAHVDRATGHATTRLAQRGIGRTFRLHLPTGGDPAVPSNRRIIFDLLPTLSEPAEPRKTPVV